MAHITSMSVHQITNDFKQIQKKKMIKMAHITTKSVHQITMTLSKYKKRK